MYQVPQQSQSMEQPTYQEVARMKMKIMKLLGKKMKKKMKKKKMMKIILMIMMI